MFTSADERRLEDGEGLVIQAPVTVTTLDAMTDPCSLGSVCLCLSLLMKAHYTGEGMVSCNHVES